MINGGQWADKLQEKQRMYDSVMTDELSHEISIAAYEDQAEALACILMETEIPEGIASCVARGSDRLGLYVPIKFLASDAFSNLKRWAESQNLILSVGLQPDPNENIGKCLLTIFPSSSNALS